MQEQTCEWKRYPKNMNNKLHSLCSYMAMFPPSVPHYFIKRYSEEGEVVLDPFSGRGTTILESVLRFFCQGMYPSRSIFIKWFPG